MSRERGFGVRSARNWARGVSLGNQQDLGVQGMAAADRQGIATVAGLMATGRTMPMSERLYEQDGWA